MATPFLGQIGLFGFNFAPVGWALSDGQLLAISQNTALFSLLGTFYGGNGTSNFGLPDLQSRTPIHFGTDTNSNTYVVGQVGGVENVTLTATMMPVHTHFFQVTNTAADEIGAQTNSTFGQGNTGPAPGTAANTYGSGTADTALNAAAVSLTGGSLPHNNIQPSLAINMCIALTGVFPSRN